MGKQRALDLERRNIDTANLEHIIGTARIGVVPLGVDRVLVAAASPVAHERCAAPGSVVPVTGGAGGAVDLQFADLAGLDRVVGVVDHAQFVARHRFSSRAITHVARPVGKKYVQHLGRTQAVEDLHAEMLGPAPAQVRRQRLARRCADAQSKFASLGQIRAREQRGIQGRHTVENTRLVPLQARKDARWRGPLGHQHRCGADRHRKGQRIAEAIGKEKFRRGKHDVVLANAEHRLRVKLGGLDKVRMQVHHALWRAGRAGRIEPEANVVARGGCGLAFRTGPVHQFLQRRPSMRVLARHEHLRKKRQLVQDRRESRPQGIGNYQRLRAAVVEHEFVVRAGQQRIAADRHDARLDRAQIHRDKIDGVQVRHHDAALRCQAKAFQRVGGAVDALRQLCIRITALIVDERGFAGAPGAKIALDEIVRGVVVARNDDGGRTGAVVGCGQSGHFPSPVALPLYRTSVLATFQYSLHSSIRYIPVFATSHHSLHPTIRYIPPFAASKYSLHPRVFPKPCFLCGRFLSA